MATSIKTVQHLGHHEIMRQSTSEANRWSQHLAVCFTGISVPSPSSFNFFNFHKGRTSYLCVFILDNSIPPGGTQPKLSQFLLPMGNAAPMPTAVVSCTNNRTAHCLVSGLTCLEKHEYYVCSVHFKVWPRSDQLNQPHTWPAPAQWGSSMVSTKYIINLSEKSPTIRGN